MWLQNELTFCLQWGVARGIEIHKSRQLKTKRGQMT